MTHQEGTTCPHRKLNADVLMMQSAENCDRRTIRPNGQRHVKPASPCPKIGVYESDCSNRHKCEADGEDAARQTPGYGQGIPVGSIRSASHNSHSAMVTAVRSADPVCPLPEVAASRCAPGHADERSLGHFMNTKARPLLFAKSGLSGLHQSLTQGGAAVAGAA